MNQKFTLLLRAMYLFIALLCVGSNDVVRAQFPASSYGFTALSGSFVEITGGTTVTAIQTDDGTSGNIPIGFTFNYCGLTYQNIKANANGWISFNTATTATQWTNTLANLTTNSIKPALLPFWDDVAGWCTGANASVARYETTGAAPNRVFTLQMKNWQFPRNSSTAPPTYSVQVKLYETTNVIEYIYKKELASTGGSSDGATIGICDGATTPTFLTLNNSTATPTASAATFTTNINATPATDQIYRFSPPPSCSNTTSPFPTAGTVEATPGTLCVSGNVTLTFTPATAFPGVTGITYKWQQAPAAAGPYNDIPGAVTNLPTYTTTTPITTVSYFRCVVLCEGTSTILTSSASNVVNISNPGTATAINGSRCGPGVVSIGANSSIPGGSINWYTAPTGGSTVGNGLTYTTPLLSTTTTFYAASTAGTSTVQLYNVGLPAFVQNNPFITSGGGWGLNFTVSQICSIDSVGIYPIGTGSLTVVIWDAATQAVVYTAPASPVVTGTGTDKVMIFVGANNLPLGNYKMGIMSFTGLSNLRNEGFNPSAYPFTCPALSITGGSQGWSSSTPNVYYFFYDWKVRVGSVCESARVPVVATINPSTPVSRTSPAVVCNNGVATIALTPPAAPNNYSSYNWSPQTELFTNAAATIPYTGGSATTVYMKSPTVGVHTYYMMAGNPNVTTGCTYADTVKIHVQPNGITIIGNPDTLCAPGGSSTLKLDTIAGYYPGTIQWQTSTDGVNYTNIAGATTSTYVTPNLSVGQNTYYKAVVTAGSNVCETPVKYVVIANPILLGATDSFNCGPGAVTLKAQTGGNSNPKWYSTPTGGAPLGSGTPWETPYLTQTDTFYVAAEGGSGGGTGNPIQVGTGTLSYGGTNSSAGPFSVYWRRYTMQFLYTATEILAAGGNAGAMKSIAFNCTSVPLYAIPDYTIMVKFVPSTMNTLTWQTGMTQVYTSATPFMPTTGWQTFNFTNPNMVWNGTDNIVIELCRSQVQPNWNGSGNHQYTTVSGRFLSNNSDDPGSSCGITGTTTSTYLPNARFAFEAPCATPRLPVIAYIHPFPTVNLGGNINQCVDPGSAIVLDAGLQQYSPSFVWDNGPGQQVRAVNTSGTYYVTATNLYGCASSDTVQVTLRHNPVVELGNDTSVCNGVVLPLNAGTDGISYFWNTGATTSTINVNSPGTYNVFVTNAEGCTKTDTITVTMQGQLPSHNGIQITNNGVSTFNFSALSPQNVIGYEWDFGDNSPFAYSQNPSHQYANSGNYIVTLKLSSTCGEIIDTTTIHILGLGVDDVNAKIQLVLYPNPTSDKLTIEAKNNVLLEGIQVYNILGQLMQTEVVHQSRKHELSLSGLANGMYTIKVQTDKGSVTRKIDLVR